ncbi:MAG: flagellar hook-basal body complex protein [Lachnospiraceae bacterium]|nr:flagellar hook-basal body complex protein [Lachnospiraceae bacterium]
MMRSLFSGVAGLRTHQTRMDVIGNNIANVNTTAYKSQSMVFSDLLYQTTQAASGANAATGRGGINARQIGLGAKTGAISTAITQQGSAQSTNNPFDIMITGESFFIVSNGSENFFTRDGSFTIDGAGNLVMSSTGYTVMGWQVDPQTGEIISDTVSALRVMNSNNLEYPPESTTRAYASGIVDKMDTALSSPGGKIMTLTVFDGEGYAYTAKFSIHSLGSDGQYYVQLDDILNSDGVSLVDVYNLSSISEIATFGSTDEITTTSLYQLLDTATYDPGDPTKSPPVEPSYSMKYYPGNILKDYASNQLVNAADKSSIEIVLDDGKEIAVGDSVKVTGKIKLSKSELQAENFNLIYTAVEEKDENEETVIKYYWYGGGKDKDGKPVYLPNSAEYSSADGADNSGIDAWTEALQRSFKDVKVQSVTVNADGSIEMEFEQSFTATKAGKYDKANNYFIGEKIDDPLEAYGLSNTDDTQYAIVFTAPDGQAQITKKFTYVGNRLTFNTDNGTFEYIGSQDNDSAVLDFNLSATSRRGETISLTHFTDVTIDFSSLVNFNNGGTTTASLTSGADDGLNTGSGRKYGKMTGIEIAQDGTITAYYDNSMTKVLGQIAVAKFANASGLAKQGDNLYSATMNSGEFDGVGQDITSDGDYMTSGVLEMSNVDLSQEFTDMITTQRGFQANSRIITVSDTLLEELVNLKR